VHLTISTDPDLLDLDTLHRWLSEDAYWSRGRSRDVVERSVQGSLSFGAHDGDTFVGYARVVTDGATFAWLCDVYVAPTYRGRGVGTALLDAVTERLGELGVGRAMLATQDAHALYARYGFEPLAHPERWMGRNYGPAAGPRASG
jgi:GNAT superfamily N-acetyltransferase